MKKLFTKLHKLPHRWSEKAAALSKNKALTLAILCIGVVLPVAAYASSYYTIYPSMSYTAVAPGGYTTISWSAYRDIQADYCYLGYYPSSVSGHVSGESCANGGGPGGSIKAAYGGSGPPYCTGPLVYGSSASASVGPMNGATTYYVTCVNTDGWNSGSGYTGITVYPSCAASSFGSPWNGNSYLIYSGGKGSVSNWYGRYCLTNYSGSAIYIPMATPTEWNDFAARASALGIGIVSY